MNLENQRVDIVIAGGSFVGLTLALALSQASQGGLRIAIIDRTPLEHARAAASDGRATALTAASQNLYRSLGVWPQLADHAQPFTGIDITDSELKHAVRQSLLHFGSEDESGAAAACMVENHVLRDVLIEKVSAAEGVTFFAPGTVSGFDVQLHGVT